MSTQLLSKTLQNVTYGSPCSATISCSSDYQSEDLGFGKGSTVGMKVNSCFRKGSYIELSNGLVRRVEDIRTEDFIRSALCSPNFQLTESTVVKIDSTKSDDGTVVIILSYNNNRSQIPMEVFSAHPLFVYGQGWASCDPYLSLQTYDLNCQKLRVGDICLSLTQKPTTDTIVNPEVSTLNSSPEVFKKSEACKFPVEQNTIEPTTNLTYSFQPEISISSISYQVYMQMVAAYASHAQQIFNTM